MLKSLSVRSMFTVLFAIILFGFFASEASAFTITPKVIDLELERRDIVNKTITLTNEGRTPVRIYPVLNEVAVDEDGEIKTFEYAEGTERFDSVTSWIEVSRGRIMLQPGEVKEIPVRIQINPQAEPGEYHAFIAFVNASDKAAAQERALAGKGSGTIIRIALEQQRTEFLKLGGFKVDRVVTDKNEEVLTYKLQNTGQSELVPRGEVIFYDTKGNEVAAMPINAEGVEIESGGNREFLSSIPDDIPVGRYKAFLSLEYGTDQLASITDTSFFYVVPIEVMLIIFVSVLLFALILTILIYRRLNLESTDNHTQSVSMYMRQGVSEAQDHDIDLKQSKNE